MRLTENQLRDIIRNIILREGAVTPEQLSDDYIVVIKDNGMFRHTNYEIMLKYKYNHPKLSEPVEEVFADLSMRKWEGGMCDGAWEVYWAEVHEDYKDAGFGPLMYDIAMELAGSFGLMCDRKSVSEDAERVWKYYITRADVYTEDIDIDNCPSDMLSIGDEIAIRKGAEHPWHQKVYFSTNTVAGSTQPTINRLEKLGRIERYRYNKKIPKG